MIVTIGYYNGNEMMWDDDIGWWVFTRDNVSTKDDPYRPCSFCKKLLTPEGHDGCLGTLPHTKFACCGHGKTNHAYIVTDDGICTYGPKAIQIIKKLKDIK